MPLSRSFIRVGIASLLTLPAIYVACFGSFGVSRCKLCLSSGTTDPVPQSVGSNLRQQLRDIQAMTTTSMLTIGASLGLAIKARAIGRLYEFRNQSMAIQEVRVFSNDITADREALLALTEGRFQSVSAKKIDNVEHVSLSFGPTNLTPPPNFRPGVSTFDMYDGHAMVTLVKPSSPSIPKNNKRMNSLEYIKIGVYPIRVSKALAKGAKVNSAYGWVDLETPSGLPFQVVVGNTRDPLMLAAIRVPDIAATKRFLIENLGLSMFPFPLSRPVGSKFEPLPPKGSVYLSYGPDSFGLLLSPQERPAQRDESQQLLESFTIVVDTAAVNLPNFVKEQLQLGSGGAANTMDAKVAEIVASGGLKFRLIPYNIFENLQS